MSIPTSTTPVFYPESDGKPMADNTLQFHWIQILSANLDALFKGCPDVFVGGNLFWFPVEGFPDIVQAPDVFVVLGRPPGYRGSYRQWEEGDVPMTVVFEIRSPNDGDQLMALKRQFYDEYGVEEYYYFDPDNVRLEPYLRMGGDLGPVRLRGGKYTSQRLGIHFEVTSTDMVVSYPDGTPFRTLGELDQLHRAAESRAEAEAQRAEAEAQRAEAEMQRAEVQAQRAEAEAQRAEAEMQRAVVAESRASRLAELARKVRHGNASLEDLAELDRILGED